VESEKKSDTETQKYNLGEGILWRRLVNNQIVRVVQVDEEKIIDAMDEEVKLELRESVFAS